jgi:excisionase family DNA binding protein
MPDHRVQLLRNCRVVGEIKTLRRLPFRAFSMVSIKLRASEHWSKVIKTKVSQSSSTSRDRSQANNAAALGDDTGKPSLQASRAEVSPNGQVSSLTPKLLLSVPEVAELLGVSKRTVFLLLASGDLTRRKVRRRAEPDRDRRLAASEK